MTSIEKKQWSLKFIVEIISIILIFGTMFAKDALQEHRVEILEVDHQDHIDNDYRPIVEHLHNIDVAQEGMRRDLGHVKESLEKIEKKL